jgi:hypothetical protein
MIRLPKDFKEFLNLLNQHKVLYLIVGGYAVGYTLSGVQFADCYDRRNECNLDDIKVQMISFQDLVANKKAAGRPKDLADVHFFDQTHK